MCHFLRRILYGFGLLLTTEYLHYGSAASQLEPRLITNSSNENFDDIMLQKKVEEIQSYMNISIDPCDNFYEFACGNWAKINPANKVNHKTGLFERLSNGMNSKIIETLSKPIESHNTPEDIQMKNFYKSCTGVSNINSTYRADIRKLIEMFGSMPVLVESDAWNESNFDWLNTTAAISNHYGFNIILGTDFAINYLHRKLNIVCIIKQKFPLEKRGMYLNNHTAIYREKYRYIIALKLHSTLGVKKSLALRTAQEIVDFESELAKGLLDDSIDFNPVNASKLITLDKMHRRYAPTLDLKRFMNISNRKEVRIVCDKTQEYLPNLVEVIGKTPKRILANYIFYRLFAQFEIDLTKTKDMLDKSCLKLCRTYFSKSLDNMVYRHYIHNASIVDVELMWNEIKQTFKQQLQFDSSLDWISNKTRQLAIEKLSAMKFQISTYADTDLSKGFENMQLQDNRFIDNLMSVFRVRKLNGDFGPIKNFSPANFLLKNLITVPVAVLQPHYLWAPNYPKAFKFATLAFTIAHELVHGFDSRGRMVDAHGGIINWWDNESSVNFVNGQNCFKDQYSKYSYHGRLLPATNVQSENIADNGGLRIAHAAYRNWQTSHKHLLSTNQDTFPSLNYTSMQLFFISFAQLKCSDVYAFARHLLVAIDAHVPDMYRVIGPLANFKEFADEFQCKLGTRMNPVQKCQLY